MRSFEIFLLLLVSFCAKSSTKSTPESSEYRAAVVEFAVYESPNKDEIVAKNLGEYLRFISEAQKQNVDVLVFPEATLNYHGLTNREMLVKNAQVVPDPNDDDLGEVDDKEKAENETTVEKKEKVVEEIIPNTIISSLSEAAQMAHLYLVVNLVEKSPCNDSDPHCPSDGFLLFNTNVVFDREGKIISRYRKFNLYGEPFMNVTKEPEIVAFETDFGIHIGHFICFDILFQLPAIRLVQNNIRHFSYPTMWFSDMPFLTAVQTQQAWAYSNNIVLLAAGANNPKIGSTGSGIYVGKYGAQDAIMSPNEESKLLIANVPKNLDVHEGRTPKITNRYEPEEMLGLKVYEWPLNNTHELKPNMDEICDGPICCTFSLKYRQGIPTPEKIGYTYRAVVFSGTRLYGSFIAGEIYCGIVACVNNTSEGCGKRIKDYSRFEETFIFEEINIEARVELKNSSPIDLLVMPSTLDTSLLPLNAGLFSFSASEAVEKDGKSFKRFFMRTTPNSVIPTLHTYAIFGRDFEADGKKQGKGGSGRLGMAVTWTLVAVFCGLLIAHKMGDCA